MSFINQQVYGIPTYDALFKYVLDDDRIRPSFFNALIPQYGIVESTRIDDHMNPLQEFQELRAILHDGDIHKVFKDLHQKEITLYAQGEEDHEPSPHEKATEFLRKIRPFFGDIQRAFPKPSYNGTMDFVCRDIHDDYVLVEMQVVPYNHWDKRALAYIAALYGRQMKQGSKWHDIKKVIGINILGGKRQHHWEDDPSSFIRHYRFQEQINTPTRYIDGIELIQCSLENAPQSFDTVLLKDWITFFKDAPYMTPEQVLKEIETKEVREAFQRAMLISLPEGVLEKYEFEDGEYTKYSDHTQGQIAKGRAEGKEEGLAEGIEKGIAEGIEKGLAEGIEKGRLENTRKIVFNLLSLGLNDAQIRNAAEISQDELDAIKADAPST